MIREDDRLNLSLSADELAFRDEVRRFLADTSPRHAPCRRSHHRVHRRSRGALGVSPRALPQGLGGAALADGVRRHRLDSGAALYLRSRMRQGWRNVPTTRRARISSVRSSSITGPRSRRTGICRASARARITGRRATPSRARALISRRSRPRPSATAMTMSSSARRSGPPMRTRRTVSSRWCAPPPPASARKALLSC